MICRRRYKRASDFAKENATDSANERNCHNTVLPVLQPCFKAERNLFEFVWFIPEQRCANESSS
jgi:hypothetical protein